MMAPIAFNVIGRNNLRMVKVTPQIGTWYEFCGDKSFI